MLLHNECPDCSDKYTSSRHDKQESNHYTGSATKTTLIRVNLIARNSFFDLFLNYSGTSSTDSRLLWTQVNLDKGHPSVSWSSHKVLYKWLTLLYRHCFFLLTVYNWISCQWKPNRNGKWPFKSSDQHSFHLAESHNKSVRCTKQSNLK